MRPKAPGARVLRWLHPAGLLLAASLLFVAAHIHRHGDPSAAWITLRVAAMKPSFADLRMITTAASCAAPMTALRYSSPCDPWHRAFNYPELWLHIDQLGITPARTASLGIAFAVLFVLSVMALFSVSRARIDTAMVQCLSVCSPPIWYLVERGNCDIVIFSLLVWTAFACARRGPLAAYPWLALAAVLKVFPIVAFLSPQLRPRSRYPMVAWVGWTILASASFATQLTAIAKSTDHPFDDAFGLPVVFKLLFERHEPIAKLVAFSIVLVIGVALVLLVIARSSETYDDLPAVAVVLFELGATTYLFVYLLTASYVYRLAPLLLTLPYFATLGHRQGSRLLGLLSLLLLSATFWSTAYNTRHHGYFAVFPTWVAVLLLTLLARHVRATFGSARVSVPPASECPPG